MNKNGSKGLPVGLGLDDGTVGAHGAGRRSAGRILRRFGAGGQRQRRRTRRAPGRRAHLQPPPRFAAQLRRRGQSLRLRQRSRETLKGFNINPKKD